MKTVLLCLSLIYEALVLFRLYLYKKGVLRSKKPSIPTIAVGNLTAGGAGKTPLVDFLVRELQNHGNQPCILSRGYKNETASTAQRVKITEGTPCSALSLGDEPYLLALKHPSVPVYVSSNRALVAQLASLWDQPDVLVVDDGYQHIALHRDLNLLLIDAARGLGNGHLLPLGELREPEHHWNRADAIILTKCNLGFSDRVLHQLRTQLKVSCPIFKFYYKPLRLCRLDRQAFLPLSDLAHKKVLLTCGIAQPQGFELVLEHLEATVLKTVQYADHSKYSASTVASLLKLTHELHPDFWVITEKDAVKLQPYPELGKEVWILEMEVVADSEWHEFFIDFLKKVKLQ